jgi:hypothetical protein
MSLTFTRLKLSSVRSALRAARQHVSPREDTGPVDADSAIGPLLKAVDELTNVVEEVVKHVEEEERKAGRGRF